MEDSRGAGREEDPARLAKWVVKRCVDCETCRDLMEDTPCLFFPELYRLDDLAKAERREISAEELRGLLELCNLCGLCACPDVRAGIMQAKDAFIARHGLPPSLRVLEDVQRVGKLCGAAPRLANLLLGNEPTAGLLKRLMGIHPERKIPAFPGESFDAWARRRGLTDKRAGGSGRKVAYFAGCTARYLYPDVARAAVEVLEHNGVAVHVPEQKCCGMPSLLEGDRPFTFALAEFNLRELGAAVEDGYDIVCSCPTCGYMLKKVLCEGAFFSEGYRAAFEEMRRETGGDPEKARAWVATGPGGWVTPPSPRCRPPEGFTGWMAASLSDAGYFSALDGCKRIAVASHTYDLGEYLCDLDRSGKLDRRLGPISGRMAYFAPCHLKEQGIGQPWFDLLGHVPGISMERVGGPYDCCGMAGIMGFKQRFHETSLTMGSRLMQRIREKAPERLVVDCLSCRLQFNQALPVRVGHPVEILREAYAGHRG
jgi:glycerol-3-phosphate dehydrogenase subunit C